MDLILLILITWLFFRQMKAGLIYWSKNNSNHKNNDVVNNYYKALTPFWNREQSGQRGEEYVSERLNELNLNRYTVLNNLLIPSTGNTPTTQIDHVVVSNFGIFCIETKDMSGWIFGNTKDEKWTQVLFKQKERFYNPLRQNFAHVKALKKIIGKIFPNIPIFEYIVFPSADKLVISGTENVNNLTETIEKIKSKKRIIFTDTDKERIVGLLKSENIRDIKSRNEHIQNVQQLKFKRSYQKPAFAQ